MSIIRLVASVDVPCSSCRYTLQPLKVKTMNNNYNPYLNEQKQNKHKDRYSFTCEQLEQQTFQQHYELCWIVEFPYHPKILEAQLWTHLPPIYKPSFPYTIIKN